MMEGCAAETDIVVICL